MYSSIDMETVAEIDKVGKLVDASPWDGFVFVIIVRELDNFGPGLSCNGVTIHAGARSRYESVSRLINPYMAISTVYLHRPRVELVRKSNWLSWCISYPFSRGP
jgi:hypothetical protein